MFYIRTHLKHRLIIMEQNVVTLKSCQTHAISLRCVK